MQHTQINFPPHKTGQQYPPAPPNAKIPEPPEPRANHVNPWATSTPSLTIEDKVARYKWKADLGKPGEFAWIEKEYLFIDHSYQRSRLNQSRITDIAGSWDWVLCGALSVAERDGKWFVMDGQNRKLAADKRSDITKLPCLVFPLESVKREASSFCGLNSQRSAVAGVDKFKAMIVAEDQTALGLQAVLHATGHKIGASGGPKTVACVLSLWKLFKRDREVFIELWPLISDVCPQQPISDDVVRGLWGAEITAREKGLSLTQHPYRDHLIAATGEVLAAEIRRHVLVAGKGGSAIETAAIIKWLNKKRSGSKHKL